jgi:hypothetical protein
MIVNMSGTKAAGPDRGLPLIRTFVRHEIRLILRCQPALRYLEGVSYRHFGVAAGRAGTMTTGYGLGH